MSKIGFIGAGNMAHSIIAGLLNAGYQTDDIQAADPGPSAQAKQLGIKLLKDNTEIADWADVIILAVKPQILKTVCNQIKEPVKRHHNLIISIAAGIRSNSITGWLDTNAACIRIMPNTPALIGLGMSGLYANSTASEAQIKIASNIMQTVGKVVRFDNEEAIDAVTAVSGSGPAYFFLYIEAMIKAAIQQGLSEADAKTLVLQTALGATTMAAQTNVSMEELRRQVTSPGGTTEQAIQALLDGNLTQLVNTAIEAASRRSVELSNELSGTNNE